MKSKTNTLKGILPVKAILTNNAERKGRKNRKIQLISMLKPWKGKKDVIHSLIVWLALNMCWEKRQSSALAFVTIFICLCAVGVAVALTNLLSELLAIIISDRTQLNCFLFALQSQQNCKHFNLLLSLAVFFFELSFRSFNTVTTTGINCFR